ncbi:hypothetical protein B8W95_13160, partial [Staphylococcus pasteuri]
MLASSHRANRKWTYPDGLIQLSLLGIVLLGIKRIDSDVVVSQLCPNLKGGSETSARGATSLPGRRSQTYSLLECLALLQGQAVTLGDDGHD